jgi:glycosyltransferase involved in cell wall biosynthesis
MPADISVILSTFNQPDWLEKVLWGYAAQTDRDFELVIADDGSDPETRARLEKIRAATALNPLHVWHPHNGFQKSAILNKATVAAAGNYLVFSDGDCIPRNDFVAVHRQFAQPGHFLSGGYTKLPLPLSRQIIREDISSGRAFDPRWLAANGLPCRPWHKHAARRLAPFWNALTPTRATWNGHNASGWKDDILRVNGYNEDMQYGGQDRELGERLVNLGIGGIRIRYFAIVLHLDHPRGYATPESKAKNRGIRDQTLRQRLVWTPMGIQKPTASPPRSQP